MTLQLKNSPQKKHYVSHHPTYFYGMKQPVCVLRGGWQADGKGPSIWDTFCHGEGRVSGDHHGDVGCNSYELWEKDLECIRQLGLTHYRLSLSWARLLPDGTTGHVNQKGASVFPPDANPGWNEPSGGLLSP